MLEVMGTIMKDYQNFDQIFSRKTELARHEKSLPKYITNLQSKLTSLKSSYDTAISTIRSNMKAAETSKKTNYTALNKTFIFMRRIRKCEGIAYLAAQNLESQFLITKERLKQEAGRVEAFFSDYVSYLQECFQQT